MQKDYIYIKLSGGVCHNYKIILKNKCNNIVFNGITDNQGKIRIPIQNNEVYQLFVFSNLGTSIISLIGRKNSFYNININNKEKRIITILLNDANYPNIKIKGGKMILWQDIQFQ